MLPAHFDFLDQNCHYKSSATPIPHDTGLALVRPAGDRTRNRCVGGSDSVSMLQLQTYNIDSIWC